MEKITEELVRVLEREKKDFVSFAVLRRASATLKKALALREADSDATLKKRIAPFLGERLAVVRGSRGKTYLLWKLPPEDLLLSLIRSKPGKTLPQVVDQTPLTKDEARPVVNRLLEQRLVRVSTISASFSPLLVLGDTVSPSSPLRAEETETAFWSAFEELAHGRNILRTHLLRRHLHWPCPAFDGMLRRLRDAGRLQLYEGDLDNMTPEDLQNSFVDENGFRMTTLMKV